MAELFEVAQRVVNEFGQSGQKITNEQALEIYAFFKQGTVGNVNTARPGMFDLKGKYKWDAWKAKENMPIEAARAGYVSYARSVLPPEWAGRIA
jgi:diazepam-binding inhibitor (GABA receptor modulating acyl-CoA-binding protein)